jgi:hypothetical protein
MPITPWSTTEPRLSAAITPASRPTTSANTSAHSDSSSGRGKRAKNSPATLVLVMIDVRSPCGARPM